MKKNQYSVSIAMGILAGAVVALVVGNSTTAILAGVITAGIAAWVGSLQWSKAREFSDKVAKKMDISFLQGVFTSICTRMVWILLTPQRLAIEFYNSVESRKAFLCGMVAIIIPITLMIIIFLITPRAYLKATHPLYIILGIVPFAASLSSVGMLWQKYQNDLILGIEIRKDTGCYDFSECWFWEVIDDCRYGALVATTRMLYIRTGNALRIIAYPLILMPWGFVALANNKTGIAALSAMALSGIHLSTAYFVGGIDAGNINFWLSLVVTMMAGVAIGKKIGEVREESLKISPLPAIRFRHQVELVVG